MENNTKYSGLIGNLRHAFEAHADSGNRYLLVYWQGWGETTAFVGTAPGEWPWARHDTYMANDNNASILAIAFDLSRGFDEQIPEHMRKFETLECMAYKPLIHIPDRTGKIPAERQAKILQDILNPKPRLRLV